MKIAFLCTELHCLPDSGGLFDQESETVNKLERMLAARNQWFKDDSKKQQATQQQQTKLRDQNT